MNARNYTLAAGTVMIIASLLFLSLPSLLNYDAFIPFIFSVIAFLAGLVLLFSGVSAEKGTKK